MKTLKAVMPRSEELKKLLKAQYEAEYEDYQQMVEIEMQRQAQIAEEQRKWKLQQEGNKVKLNSYFRQFKYRISANSFRP